MTVARKKTFGARRAALGIAAAALLLAAAGCELLPAGDPPAGNLTDNTSPPANTPLAVRNGLITQLIAFALQNGVTELDPGSDPEGMVIAAEAAKSAGFRLDPASPLRLDFKRRGDGTAELAAVRKQPEAEVWRSLRP